MLVLIDKRARLCVCVCCLCVCVSVCSVCLTLRLGTPAVEFNAAISLGTVAGDDVSYALIAHVRLE